MLFEIFVIILPAWLAGVLLSFITAPLGGFVLWRKMAYFGDTLSHSALLGVSLGFFFMIDPYVSVLATTLLLAVLLSLLERQKSFSLDTLLGIAAHTSLSLGIITIFLLGNVRVDLMGYLFGDLLAVNYQDVFLIALGALVVVALMIAFFKPLLMITISSDLAQIEGIKVERYRLLLMMMMALTIALAMKFVGALIITSLLIIPSATARRFARSPKQMIFFAFIFGVLAVSCGLVFSGLYDTPAGPSVVLSAGVIFVISLLKKSRC